MIRYGQHGVRRQGQLAGWVGRVFARPQPIEVVEQRYNFLPRRFRSAGCLWSVRAIRRSWDVAATAILPPRRYFHVLCDDGGERMLFQELRQGMWYLSA